jgi:glyoxylate/hydroxypyruvate reductase A
MAVLFLAPDIKPDSWVKHLRREDPQIDLRVWPAAGRAEEIDFVLCWKHPPGELKKYVNLKCIASLGFGVDHILSDPDLPPGVPITRIVDPDMIRAMREYVLAAVLNHTRQFDLYRREQLAKTWQPRLPRHPQTVRVGVMGLGHLGADIGQTLSGMGFAVHGWSRSEKRLPGIESFAGADALEAFLSRSDILICLLPLTPATRGILDRRTLARLPQGAYVINAARGEHVVEEDLLAAVQSGHLAGACLDVFRTEPLPAEHPFWSHPQITVTPHIASLTYPRAVAPQLIDTYRRVRAGLTPEHTIDPQAGY